MKKDLHSRISDEKQEKVDSKFESDVNGEKFQNQQQIVKPVAESGQTDVVKNDFSPKRVSSKGSQLKQEAVSKVLTGIGGGVDSSSVSLSGQGLKSLAYSGNEGTILGSVSGTPNVGSPSRSNTRPGQKLDAILKAIDFAACETVIQDYDGSVPLQDNPDDVQGFLGHPENDQMRSQKNSEGVPGGLMYQRSADELSCDYIVYSAGQTVKQDGINYRYEPTEYYSVATGNQHAEYHIERGNYIPKALRFGINSQTGELVAINYDVDNVSCNHETYDIVNAASDNFLCDLNTAEINRQNIETKAGDETKDGWSVLARAANEPTPLIGFLTDDEIITGSEDFMGYRFFNKEWGYLLNKVGKDGQVPYRSFKEMLYGYSRSYQNSNSIDVNAPNFNAIDYLKGAPSLMIPLYDSIAKYSKRGDLFTQPRGWKMHKQTADNAINQFRLKPQFAATVSSIDTFSTIDRDYDPLLPVCITDGFRVAHPYSFNDLFRMQGHGLYITKMKGKGLTTAGSAFNTFVDDTASTGYISNTLGQVYRYDSSTTTVSTTPLYTQMYGTRTDDSRKLDYLSVRAIAAEMDTKAHVKDGYETYDEGALAAMNYIEEFLNNRDNFNIGLVLMFKVPDETADDVYSFTLLPNIYLDDDIVATYIAHSTTTDALTSDMTAASNDHYLRNPFIKEAYGYFYHNKMNDYTIQVRNPLLYGVYEWIRDLAGKLRDPSVTNNTAHVAAASNAAFHGNIIWYYVPIAHYTRQMSLWDMIVCASMPYQQKIRTNSQYDVLKYTMLYGYPFPQLQEISSLNPLSSVNYTINGIEKPLSCNLMKDSSAIRWVAPEKFWRIGHHESTGTLSAEKLVLPYYFSEEQFHITHVGSTTAIVNSDDGFVMNYPTVRSGSRWAYTDKFFGMSERDVRLCLDRLIRIPGTIVNTGTNYQGVYKYSASNSGIPAVFYDTTNGLLTQRDYLSTPRELGWFCLAPLGYVCPAQSFETTTWTYGGNQITNIVSTDALGVGDNSPYFYNIDNLMSLGSSFRMRIWKNANVPVAFPDILENANVIVSRAASFSQQWIEQADALYAPYGGNAHTLNIPGITFNPIPDLGISLNMSDAVTIRNGGIEGRLGDSTFYPFTYGNLSRNNQLATIISLQKPLWTRIQALPFALSPFDQTPVSILDDTDYIVLDAQSDPYDLMYVFGFCGFKGSDYREDVYNRIYERQTLGWQYQSDPFVKASPVLKDGGFSG